MSWMRCVGVMLALVGSGIASAQDVPPGVVNAAGEADALVAEPPERRSRADAFDAFQSRLAEGVTPETNAIVRLWECIGSDAASQLPDEYFERLGIDRPAPGGPAFVSVHAFLMAKGLLEPQDAASKRLEEFVRRGARPWRAADDPVAVEWLEENATPLAIAAEAVRLPGAYSPLVPPSDERGRGSLYRCLLPGTQCCRQIGRGFCVRAMVRLGEGDADGAWSDLLAVYRLARAVARGGTLVDLLVANALDESADRAALAFLETVGPDDHGLADRLRDLVALPGLPTVAERIDHTERFAMLDTVALLGEQGFDAFDFGDGGPAVGQPMRAKCDRILASLDLEPAFETVDAWFDRLAADLAEPDRSLRAERMSRFAEDVRGLNTRSAAPHDVAGLLLAGKPADAALSRRIGEVVVGLLMPATDAAVVAADRVRQTHDIVLVAFALASYQRVHGRYPEMLSDLCPDVLDEVPDDLFRGGVLTYRPDDDGFLVWGVGPNLRDDGGPSVGAAQFGDDIGVRVTRAASVVGGEPSR